MQEDTESVGLTRHETPSDPFDVVLSWPDAGPESDRGPVEHRSRGFDDFGHDEPATGSFGPSTSEGVPILPLMAAQIESIVASVRTLEVRVDHIATTISEQSRELLQHQQRLDSATSALRDALSDDEHVPQLAEQLATLAAEVGAAGSFREAVQSVHDEVAALVDAVAGLPDAARIEQALVRVASVAGSDPGSGTEVVDSVQTMRDDLARLTDFVVGLPDAAHLEELLATAPATRASGGSGGDVLDALMSLHDEVAALKRRIPVRAKATVRLEDDQIEAVARAVITELESKYDLVSDPVPAPPPPSAPAEESRRRRRR